MEAVLAVSPLHVWLWWAWLTLLAGIVYWLFRLLVRIRFKGWRPRHEWKIFMALSLLLVLPWVIYREIYGPLMGGIYGNDVAAYWMRRAAAESEADKKREHIARVALSSEYGSHIAGTAIDRVSDARERCRLRTILAGLPGVRGLEERKKEAHAECARKL